MATFTICVFEHQKRRDGKYPLSIKVFWKGEAAYINSAIYVTDKQVSKKIYYNAQGQKRRKIELKDSSVINVLNARISKYEDIKVKKLGYNIEGYSAKQLAEYLKKEGIPGTDSSIDFVEFGRIHCSRLDARGKKTTADTFRRTINSMIDFCNGREKISFTDINVKFLNQFESYLRTTRKLKRKNQFGNIVETEKEGLADVSIRGYMTDIRTLFNAAMDEYNDEDLDEIRIKHYPFRKYKLQKGPEPDKRVLSVEQIRLIRDISGTNLTQNRAILARDVFMLSFYLAGMNTADLYEMKKSEYKNSRLSYCRKKTRDRRQDKAFISIKVFPEALPLFEKYTDKKGSRVFNFADKYCDYHNFNAAVNIGLKKVATACKIEKLSTYHSRFTFATIARNDCDISRDDIGLSLNHVDKALKVTDGYLKKDWSKIDNAIRKVIDHLNILPLPVSNQSADIL